MLLPLNSPAPNFELTDSSGKPVSLNRDLKGRAVALFFYPKDETRVCTAEVCGFRDAYAELETAGVAVYGISRDGAASHRTFRERFKLPYELLSDPGLKVAKVYGAVFPFLPFPRRVSYLLDREHRILASVGDFFSADAHVDAVVARVREGV